MTGLVDRRVLVVEDEYFVADDIAQELAKLGAEVLGPASTVAEAEAQVGRGGIDIAILDINLREQMAFPVADLLARQGVPFIFTTGYGGDVIPSRHQHVPRWEKPFDPEALVQAVADMLKHPD